MQVCQCDACLKVGSARADPDFLAMQTAAGLMAESNLAIGELEATAEDMLDISRRRTGVVGGGWSSGDPDNIGNAGGEGTDGGGGGGGSRLLLQSSEAMLQAVLDAVGTLQDSQAALRAQVETLEAEVADAAAAAKDGSTQALVAAGQQQILSGQAAIQGMLGEILGKQTAAAAAAAAQMQALANLQSLQQQQLAAQAQLEQSAKDQTEAIAIALQQDMLTLRWVARARATIVALSFETLPTPPTARPKP